MQETTPMATISVSGTVRITNTSTIFTRTFSAGYTASTFVARDIVLLNGVSDSVVSLAEFSNPVFVMLMGGTSLVRVNFGDHASADSAASLGFQFNDLWTWIGSGQSGPIDLHLANSSGDSATLTLIAGM
jgi:hypothetical protein